MPTQACSASCAARAPARQVLAVCNFTPVPRRRDYTLRCPHGGWWRELLNSDAEIYGGGNQGNAGGVMAEAVPDQGRPFSLRLTLPPLGILYLKLER